MVYICASFVSVLLLFDQTICVQLPGTPTLRLKSGELKGDIRETANGKQYYSFQSIPFAEPPIGNLRFRAPIPVKAWNGVLDATKPHPACPQRNSLSSLENEIEGNEDCLYLNVYSPNLLNHPQYVLPVMVFIHGGGYFTGSANTNWYEAEPLIEKDVIVVTTNYRISILGFLSTEDDASPGNYGLKDQALALKWVKENIQTFGGDPNQITIFGESAGGSSVHFHMLSPLSRGLFHRAIAESGSALCSWALAPCGEGIENSKRLAERLGCPTSSTQELVDCLRGIDVKTITGQDKLFLEWDIDPVVPFKPVVENPSPEAFLTDIPENLIRSGQFIDVPIIFGINKEEGLLRAAAFTSNPKMFEELDGDFNNKIATGLLYKHLVRNPDDIGQRIRKFYFHRQNINSKASLNPLIKMYGDGMFGSCVNEAVRVHQNFSSEPVFYYLFAHRGKYSFSSIFRGTNEIIGVSHADEMRYLFSRAFTKKMDSFSADDNKMKRIMSSMWTDFAKTGNPTPTSLKWIPVSRNRSDYFVINTVTQEMKQNLLEGRFRFWKEITGQFEKCLI